MFMRSTKYHPPQFFFTIDAEEWFASKFITTTSDDRAQATDFSEPMDYLRELLKAKGVRGTFFFLFHTAKKYRAVVQRLVADKHEIALHGDEHDNILDLGPEKFRLMLRNMGRAFQEEFGIEIRGYRVRTLA